MRFAGRIEPASGVGGAGHLAAMRRPKATADAKVLESCLLRPGIRRGATVSAAPSAIDSGGGADGFVATESTPLPSGGGTEPGSASRPAHDAAIESVNTNAM